MRLGLLLFALLLFAGCSQPTSTGQHDANEEALGSLGYTFTGSEAARPAFERGLLLLHSFEYDDAREAFREAQQADSTMAMAYWGEAMTHYKALWGRENKAEGEAALAKLAGDPEARLAKAANELERDFLQSTELLFGEGTAEERHDAFAGYLADMHERYPDNQEVAAFYALSLIWNSDDEQENFDRSARIANSILAENPNHPGALHYLIHAYDYPSRAAKAIPAANAYAEVAPSAAHALHMPSHIYVAMGMWEETVRSNEAAYQASVDRMTRKGLAEDERDFHSLQWLMYGYLQQGRYADARRLLADMDAFHRQLQLPYTKEYLGRMRGAYYAETGRWTDTVSVRPLDINALNIFMKAQFRFVDGFRAGVAGDAGALRRQIDSLDAEIAKAALSITEDAEAMCSAGGSRYAPTEKGVKGSRVMLLELEAALARLEGKEEQAGKKLAQAARLEQEIDFLAGPPRIVWPAPEMYGRWLLEQGRYEEALAQFDLSLGRAPQRVQALLGKWEALDKMGRQKQAEAVRKEVLAIWQEADPEVREELQRDPLSLR
mgnify:CR=1 FL=1